MSGDPSFDEAKRSLGDGPTETRRGLQRVRLLRAHSLPRAPRRALQLALGALAVGAVLALLVFPRPVVPVRDALGPVTVGALLVAEGARQLDFSDGSQVMLREGGAVRLEAIDSSQVELVLERGHLDAQVTKGTGRTWRYHAGPWTIRVVGTKLSIDWAPGREVVDVAVTEGAVEVSGPWGAPVLVRAGESLQRATHPAPHVEPPEEPAPPQQAASGVEAPPRPRALPPPLLPPEVEPPEVVSARPSWQELLARGQRSEALEEASLSGAFAGPLEDPEALALADAARHERRGDVARLLLARVLERNGANAAEAAFLLGRLELDAHRAEVAQGLFSRSVSLAPEGPFAEQSRGRLLEVLLESKDLPAAREAARDYLAHHPGGAWAHLAKKLEQAGPP